MRTLMTLTAALALTAPVLAGPTLETAAFAARNSFYMAHPAGFTAVAMPAIPGVAVPGQRSLFESKLAAAEGSVAAQGGPAAEADLKALLNAHLKAQLTVTLGGKKTYISGVFDRQQNAFLSVWIEGEAGPVLFNIKGLMDKEGSVQAGATGYKIYLEANPLQPLKSKIAFENKANEDDVQTVRLGNLLNAIEASGQVVALTGQSYRLFYFQDVQESGGSVVLNPNSRTIALILKDGDEMHVFLIPEESVASDKLTVFKVYKDKKIGVQNAAGKLRIFEL
ncbi:MAG: hypothetical protein FD126_1157 [Elusimicrobia bacterium]|nr:MAG: hypothetical protein FD126_1157 [Elusimicrobiota bacterium]